MSRTMVRWTVAGALVLAAAGGLPSDEAGAAPKARGATYIGQWPGLYGSLHWDISIASDGAVKGSYRQSSSVVYTPQHGGDGSFRVRYTFEGTMSGVLADGVLSVSGSTTQTASSKNDAYNYTYTFTFARTATVVEDADGHLHGTSDTGETFVWWRQ